MPISWRVGKSYLTTLLGCMRTRTSSTRYWIALEKDGKQVVVFTFGQTIVGFRCQTDLDAAADEATRRFPCKAGRAPVASAILDETLVQLDPRQGGVKRLAAVAAAIADELPGRDS